MHRKTIIPFFNLFLAAFFLILVPACRKTTDNKLPELNTCKPVTPANRLKKDSAAAYSYETKGGGIIIITQTQTLIKHKDYAGFKIEFWGSVGSPEMNSGHHENLNGKHIKDRKDPTRSVVFPDGTKITMVTQSIGGNPVSIRIYEGDECHVINAGCSNTLEYSGRSSFIASTLDEQEPDGETCSFEFTATGLLFVNIYKETVAGQKQMERVELGEIVRDNPSLVRDYYDDPTLPHT